MTKERRFYVYVHHRPAGDPFYVGKGYGKRHSDRSKGSRTAHYLNVLLKYGEQNILTNIFDCFNEDLAFKLEIELIAYYRQQGYNLVNMTDGGEGASGYVPTKEQREKVSSRQKGKIHSLSTREKLSRKLMGHSVSEETKHKIKLKKQGKHIHKRNLLKVMTPWGQEMGLHDAATASGIPWTRFKARYDLGERGEELFAAGRRTNSSKVTGRKGYRHTDDARAKIAASKLGKKGTSPTAETRAKLSAKADEHWSSPGAKEAVSQTVKALWKQPEHRIRQRGRQESQADESQPRWLTQW